MTLPALATMLVGSYPQPDWLIDRARLAGRFPPRVRAQELWRVAPELPRRRPGRRDAAGDPRAGKAGLDIVTDGEIRRESYSNRFATALDGVDLDNPGDGARPQRPPEPGAARRRADPAPAPGRGARPEVPAAHTDRRVKITVPGPFTMAQQAQNDYYADAAAAAHGLRGGGERGDPRPVRGRRRRRADRRALHAGAAGAGARVRRCTRSTARWRASPGTTAVHICFGYAAIIHERPSGYSFLPELAGLPAGQVSIETAQSNLDRAVLESLRGKKIILGVIDLAT